LCYFYLQVALAAQTLSSSVAKALEFVHSLGIPDFNDVQGTVSFVRMIDQLFDILNSRTPTGKGFKQPITRRNFAQVSAFLDRAATFIANLKVNGVQIVRTTRGTGFIGFLFCIQSLLGVSRFLLVDGPHPQRYVLTYRFSQDHLELFFNAIRGSLGWNNNPTATQLQYVMRRMHARVGITGDSDGNCLNFSGEVEDSPPPIDIFEDDDFVPLSPYITNIVAYISGFVVKKVLKHDKCPACRSALVMSPSQSFLLPEDRYFLRLKDNGGLVLPSSDVVAVLQQCESAYRNLTLRDRNPQDIFLRLFPTLPTSLFCNSHFQDGDHRARIIQSLTVAYCSLRSHHVARVSNLSDVTYRRFNFNKQVLFHSQ
jgi:hypothetical protein